MVGEQLNESQSWSGDAMNTLKAKIGIILRENCEATNKMELMEQEKKRAEESISKSEKKIGELTKLIHTKKIQVDEKSDQLIKQSKSLHKKEEAILAAKEELQVQALKEMSLKAEKDRVFAALSSTSDSLCKISEGADKELGRVKKLEIRAMLAEQTIEEMEQQLLLAQTMSINTNQKAEEMKMKLMAKESELEKIQEKAELIQSNVENHTQALKASDRKMAELQFSMEGRTKMERHLKKQQDLLKAKIADTEARIERECDVMKKIKKNIDLKLKM